MYIYIVTPPCMILDSSLASSSAILVRIYIYIYTYIHIDIYTYICIYNIYPALHNLGL